jgi:hypothetical protein
MHGFLVGLSTGWWRLEGDETLCRSAMQGGSVGCHFGSGLGRRTAGRDVPGASTAILDRLEDYIDGETPTADLKTF